VLDRLYFIYNTSKKVIHSQLLTRVLEKEYNENEEEKENVSG
jgi:hypothetical protein